MAHLRVVQRATGIAYEVRWRDRGKFRQRTFTVKREAERFALRVEDEVKQGNTTDVYRTRSSTVREVVEVSMEASRAGLKPRTLRSYRQSYDCHILPVLGDRRISTVTSLDVEAWLTGMVAKGLAPATIRNNYVALVKVFRYALRHRLISHNPCEAVRPAKGERFQPRFLTASEVEGLAAQLDAAAPYGLMVRVAAWTGLRAGELAGLRVRDVNVMRRRLEVRRTIQRGSGEWVVGTPKSERSTRDVPVLHTPTWDALVNYLESHPRRHEPDAALWPGRAPGGHGELRNLLDYGRPFDHQSTYRNYFKPAAARAQLGALRFHDLRHTYASLMAEAGIDIRKVSRWMGHANINTTDSIYTHLFDADYADAIVAVDGLGASASKARQGDESPWLGSCPP